MSTNEKLVPGMVLGRYELLLPIAQGGMATVWAARQRGTRGFNKTVAIKTMLPALSEDPQFEQMFLDEATLAAKIHHPNVAEILDLGEEDEILYIVMEWVDGEALSVIHRATRKNQAHMPIRLSLRIVKQASAALHAAHELRDENDVPLMLVHRDVSPQNILCTYDGIVKLVDFGVAKATGRPSDETTAGQLKGKVPYMSPEQAAGGVVDRRTDIFAMGIVLYKLTTGLHPFLGENDLVTMRNIISRPLFLPRMKNPSFPQDVEQILLKCLQKDADKRYQTMAELGQAVDHVLAGMGLGEEDLGAYVRSVMGDHGARRRTAVRDAVRVADERYATGTHSMLSLQAPQMVHEGVSELLLTKMSPGSKEDLLPSSASSVSHPPSSSPVPPPPSSSSIQWIDPASQQAPHSRPGGKKGLFVGVAAAVAAAVAGVAVVQGSPSAALHTDTAHAATQSVMLSTAVAPPSPPAQSVVSPPTQPDPPSPPVSAVPPAPAVGAVSIDNLPDAAGEKNEKKRPAAAAPARVAPEGDKPIRKVATDKVPMFTNPGF